MAGVYSDTDQSAVLDAVVARLIDQISALSTKNCLLSIVPDPPFYPVDNLFVTVSPNGSKFPEEFQDGGGQNQCTEDGGVLVTIYSRFAANRPGHEAALLNDQARGILKMKRLILKALVGQNLTSAVDANFVLRNLISAKDSSPPEYAGKDNELARVAVSFALTWDWNLTL